MSRLRVLWSYISSSFPSGKPIVNAGCVSIAPQDLDADPAKHFGKSVSHLRFLTNETSLSAVLTRQKPILVGESNGRCAQSYLL